jgi:conjugative transfer signal peptidase TraF
MSRAILVAIMASGVGLVAAPAVFDPPALLVWNASASAPMGLYRIEQANDLAVGDLVLVQPTPDLAALLAARRYLAPGVPLLKHVAAIEGQTVCRNDDAVAIAGEVVATARSVDRAGRPLPSWQGCVQLGPDAVFVLNREAPDSLDGRYFGSTPVGSVRGHAIPLWTSTER